MGRLWSEESKYVAWLRVELAVCEAYTRRGRIHANVMARIRQKARVDVGRILAIQERVKHEMIALLTSLEEQLGEDSRFVHIGLTTSDVWDTATALQLRDAADLLIAGQERLAKALAVLALRHKDTLTIGRTHGVHAEPTSFGLKVAVWYTEAGRNLERLRRARTTIGVGKLSGAVGNFAHVEPDLEAEVCRELGLEAAPVSTQIVQRDRHAEFCAMLAVAAASLEKIALEVRGLQRTEILEAQEPFGEGHDVDPARMRENLELSHGLVYSQRVLLKLTDAGLARQVAYEIVQRNAMRAWKERQPFFELLAADPNVTARLSPDELKSCFDPAFYLKNVDAIFKRLGLTQ